jgi:hypothetical protein
MNLLFWAMLKGTSSAGAWQVARAAAAPTLSRTGYAMSPLLDFRRQKLRKGWVRCCMVGGSVSHEVR